MPDNLSDVYVVAPSNNSSAADVSLDDLRFSDQALSPSELGYNGSFTIPEPATVALLGLGLAGLGFGRRRRSSR